MVEQVIPDAGKLVEKERAMLEVLENFPSNGKFGMTTEAIIDLMTCRFIENQEMRRNCPTCGSERTIDHYFRITAGGRFFMSAALRAQASSDTAKSEGMIDGQ